MRRFRVACFMSVCLLAGTASGVMAEDGFLAPADPAAPAASEPPVVVGETASNAPDPAVPAASTPATEVPADVTSDPIERAAADGAPPATALPSNPGTARAKARARPGHTRTKARHRHKKREKLLPTYHVDRSLPEPNAAIGALSPEFAAELLSVAHGAGIDWAVLLAVSRTSALTRLPPAAAATSSPLAALQLRGLAWRLADLGARSDSWHATVALAGRGVAAERARALWRLFRSIGIEGLVEGVEGSGGALADLVLHDARISLTAAGRQDVASGGIDPRVLVSIRYLAESFGQISVSCLKTGHRHFARPGVVSAHVYGRAVDVSAVGGIPIAGHQGPDTVTEHALAALLLLPPEETPVQVISLVELSGRTLAMGDHGDHIHIGYR